MAIPLSKTELLKSQAQELVKSYTTYDAYNRPEYFYVAQADAVHGASCIVTQYTYDGTTSRMIKRRESYTTWNSSYDI